MSFASQATSLLSSPNRLGHVPTPSSPARFAAGGAPFWKILFTARSNGQYKAISRARNQGNVEYIDEIQKGPQVVLEAENSLEDDTQKDTDQIRELVENVRVKLQNIGGGGISISAYDTAWVALVEDINGSGQPQFPTSLDWISNHQFPDGSWGSSKFLYYDRILCTLACIVALKTWNVHPDKYHKGLDFIRENIHKLADEEEVHMPIGFEVAFPSIIETAKKVGIEIPEDFPGKKEIYAKRDLKLKKIPMDILHKMPTPLLFSIEGMEGLDWQKLFKFRDDGSFLTSPSSTAYALQQTKDELCLKYLTDLVKKDNGGVPNAFPVDLFDRNYTVDRLRRLGISRYFQPEIEECMKYVYRFWDKRGISWARNTNVQDLDDTAQGFRNLRMHGYEVTLDVFKQFEKCGEFFSFHGQSSDAVLGMFNLYRASQVLFPGEHMLADARKYAANYLHKRRLNNRVVDKWIINKDLEGEVAYGLDVPFYASLPRLEARFYIEQYGGSDDVWIGKALYRMVNVSCDTYLELAKLDYNKCQSVHQNEWKSFQKWYKSCSLGEFGFSEGSLLQAYYIAASTIFEPEKSGERLAWAKTAALMETIQQLSSQQKREFVDEFKHKNILKNENGERYRSSTSLVETLISTVNQLSSDILLEQGRDVHQELCHVWLKWLSTWEERGNLVEAEAELLLRTLHLNSGLDESSFSHPKYQQLLEVSTKVCHLLRLFQKRKVYDPEGCTTDIATGTTFQIEACMQELVKLVFSRSSEDLDSLTKLRFLDVARSFYYTAHCDPQVVESHIDKVLFEKVV
uniref:Terpene synthase 2 n=1 Tax=Ajuga reptans TaxID=38596 RepID=A0A3G6V9V3_AJURE|nr:terpene synthase 2 [Ajuga reptans]